MIEKTFAPCTPPICYWMTFGIQIVGLEDSLCLDKGTFSAKKKVKKNDAVKNRSLKFCDMIA